MIREKRDRNEIRNDNNKKNRMIQEKRDRNEEINTQSL
jgi:hypothetical protein